MGPAQIEEHLPLSVSGAEYPAERTAGNLDNAIRCLDWLTTHRREIIKLKNWKDFHPGELNLRKPKQYLKVKDRPDN